jgi:hypothetical protein
METEFKAGDIVKLEAGGPEMMKAKKSVVAGLSPVRRKRSATSQKSCN